MNNNKESWKNNKNKDKIEIRIHLLTNLISKMIHQRKAITKILPATTNLF